MVVNQGGAAQAAAATPRYFHSGVKFMVCMMMRFMMTLHCVSTMCWRSHKFITAMRRSIFSSDQRYRNKFRYVDYLVQAVLHCHPVTSAVQFYTGEKWAAHTEKTQTDKGQQVGRRMWFHLGWTVSLKRTQIRLSNQPGRFYFGSVWLKKKKSAAPVRVKADKSHPSPTAEPHQADKMTPLISKEGQLRAADPPACPVPCREKRSRSAAEVKVWPRQ